MVGKVLIGLFALYVLAIGVGMVGMLITSIIDHVRNGRGKDVLKVVGIIILLNVAVAGAYLLVTAITGKPLASQDCDPYLRGGC